MDNEELNQNESIEFSKDSTPSKKVSVWKDARKRASIISAIIVFCIIFAFTMVLWLYFFIINYPTVTVTHKNISDLKKTYTLDSTNEYIANINYEDYLYDTTTIWSQIKDLFIHSYNLSEEGVLETNNPVQNGDIINSLIENSSGSLIIYVDGNYKTTPIKLKSNVTIVINENCSLIGPTYQECVEYNIDVANKGILYAEGTLEKNISNIKIYGPGSIVCNGATYTDEAEDSSILQPLEKFNLKTRVLQARKRIRKAKKVGDIEVSRPHALYFANCENIDIESVLIKDSANWTCKFVDSKDISIADSVIDNNLHVANADGLDFISCQSVDVKHVFVATADDGLCIKANGTKVCKNISFNRCTVISMANCFKIGTETTQEIKNIDCVNCYFAIPEGVVGGYAGIAIESADGSNIYDVNVDNIYMEGISATFLIWLGSRLNTYPGSIGEVGSISKITISNVVSNNIEMPSAVTGCIYNDVTYRVENVTIANYKATYRNTQEELDIGDAQYEEGMNGYPEITRVIHSYLISHELSVYKDLPVYGVFARHVSGITLNNVNIESRSCSTLKRDNIKEAADRYDLIDAEVK